jgi:phage-related protein
MRTAAPAVMRGQRGGAAARPAAAARSRGPVSDLALRKARVQTKLEVNRPGDRFERQADAVASRVMRSPLPAEDTQALEQAQNPRALQRAASSSAPAVGSRAAQVIRSPGAGQPLAPGIRSRIEPQVGANLSGVRVHTDPASNAAAASLQARAFTHGSHIYLHAAEQPGNLQLMAHESTHVVQQGAAPIQRQALEGVRAAQTPDIQRDWTDDLAAGAGAVWDEASGAVVDAAGTAVAMGADFFWSAVERVAPRLAPILRQIQREGILGYLGGIIRTTFSRLFDGLVGSPGAFEAVLGVFNNLLERVRGIMGALMAGDCAPLLAAVNEIKETVQSLASDVWTGITDFFRPIGEFFSGLWQRFGAPVIDWITATAGEVWQTIQNLGAEIWSWTQPLRDDLAAAWTWVKTQLFGPEDPASGDSQGGLVGWVVAKAGEAWDAIKRELAPVIEPIQGFARRVMAFLPLDAILNLRERVTGFLGNLQNMTQNMAQPQDAVNNQVSLRDEILPGVMNTIGAVQTGLRNTGAWVVAQVGGISSAVGGMVESLRGNSILSGLAGAVSWVQDGINRMGAWAGDTVGSLTNQLADGLTYLARFIRPVLEGLQRVVDVLSDLIGQIGGFITGVWTRIPACIREPLQEFIMTQILGRIPIFAQLMQIGDVWGRLVGTVMTILRQVFVNGDLLGAIWTFFRSMLELLGIPPELVLNIVSKAAQAITDILNDPVGFFINLLNAVKAGFERFFGNILTHLLGGVTGWLFGELSEAGIRPPQDLSLGSIISFILEVLGITVDNFFERLGDKIGRERAQAIRRVVDRAAGVIRWIVRLVNEGPGALWEEIQSQLSNLWSMVLNAVIGWLNRVIIERAVTRLLSMLDPSGIMAVVNSIIAIYNAIQSFVRYIRQILEVVNTAFEGLANIARGVIDQAAGFLESGLARILPIAIGFLANQVGLGGVGRRIGEMVETVREYVNRGLDWLIDRSIAAFNALMGRGEEGQAGDYSRIEEEFDEAGGGDSHRLYFVRRGEALALYIASSNPKTYAAFIDSLDPGQDPTKTAAKQAAIPIANDIDQIVSSSATQAGAPGQTEDKSSELREKLNQLSVHSAILIGAGGSVSSPPIWGPLSSAGFGTRMTIEYLTKNPAPGITGGAPTGAYNQTYDDGINLRRQGGRSYYVKGHLLSQKLNGPGTWQNLTPLFQNTNRDHEIFVERVLKQGVVNNLAFQYTVDSIYGRGRNIGLINQIINSSESQQVKDRKVRIVEAEEHVPLYLNISAIELDPATRQPKPGGINVSHGIINRVDQSSPDNI